MLSVVEAQQRLLDGVGPLQPGPVALDAAGGLVLADAVVADRDLPGFDNSAMDGFAVIVGDLANATPGSPARLRLVGEVAAGQVYPGRVDPGTAVRIMTGAPLPTGAEAVLEVEETAMDGEHVLAHRSVHAGQSVRRAGTDIAAGGPALAAGTFLGPAQVALLAALGVARPVCVPRPRVALVTTGDELMDVAAEPGPGQVVDVALPALSAALDAVGAVALPFPRIPDNQERIEASLRDAAGQADLVVSVGGVSMGGYDLVRAALEHLGRLDFWKVATRPGKPIAVGELMGRRFIGLPGNPVSALVGFEVYVLPLLMALSGTARVVAPAGRGAARLRAHLAGGTQDVCAGSRGGGTGRSPARPPGRGPGVLPAAGPGPIERAARHPRAGHDPAGRRQRRRHPDRPAARAGPVTRLRAPLVFALVLVAACAQTRPTALIPTPTPQLPTQSWRWVIDSENRYELALPPGWESVKRASGSLDADVASLRQRFPQAGAYIQGTITGTSSLPDLKLLAVDPLTTRDNYIAHVSVIRVDLARAGQGPNLDAIGRVEGAKAAAQEGIQGRPTGARVKIGPGDAYKVSYVISIPSGGTALATSYFFLVDIGPRRYQYEVATASATPAWAEPLMQRIVGTFHLMGTGATLASAALR